jgi:hypothetical protein
MAADCRVPARGRRLPALAQRDPVRASSRVSIPLGPASCPDQQPVRTRRAHLRAARHGAERCRGHARTSYAAREVLARILRPPGTRHRRVASSPSRKCCSSTPGSGTTPPTSTMPASTAAFISDSIRGEAPNRDVRWAPTRIATVSGRAAAAPATATGTTTRIVQQAINADAAMETASAAAGPETSGRSGASPRQEAPSAGPCFRHAHGIPVRASPAPRPFDRAPCRSWRLVPERPGQRSAFPRGGRERPRADPTGHTRGREHVRWTIPCA